MDVNHCADWPYERVLIVWACRDLEMSWWLGGPAVIVVVVVGTIAERRIERAYLSPLRGH